MRKLALGVSLIVAGALAGCHHSHHGSYYGGGSVSGGHGGGRYAVHFGFVSDPGSYGHSGHHGGHAGHGHPGHGRGHGHGHGWKGLHGRGPVPPVHP